MAEEQKLQSKIISYLTKQGWEVIKTVALSKAGYEDLFCFKDGVTMFIEVKSKGKKPRPLQVARIQRHNEMGFKSFWCDSWEMFLDLYN